MKKSVVLVLMAILAGLMFGCNSQEEVEGDLEFSGQIKEITGSMAIVSVDDGEEIRRSGDLVEVDLSKSETEEFTVGDRVMVVYTGQVEEKYPLGIETVEVILLASLEVEEGQLEEVVGQEDLSNYEKISRFLREESYQAFSPYYEILDYKISNYNEELVDGRLEATFLYTIISKNYDKDPDTVKYIREAKESGNENYQQMYDEYLQAREMNFDFKVIISEEGHISLYSNIAPKGVEWEETKMTDYILSK